MARIPKEERGLPRILVEYLERTEQFSRGPLSEAHLLNEAEWCLWNAICEEGSSAYAAHPASKKALERYVDRQRAKGILPKRDFND